MTETKKRSVWADRFLFGAIVQGTAAFVVMAILLWMNYVAGEGQPSPARVVANGSAGMWFVTGLIGYALVGVLGIAVSALFYHYIEVTKGAPYKGWRNWCAWAHLVVGGGAASIAALWAAWGGLDGGLAQLRGEGSIVHSQILGPISEPIGYIMAVALLGFFLGGVGYVSAWYNVWREERAESRATVGTTA